MFRSMVYAKRKRTALGLRQGNLLIKRSTRSVAKCLTDLIRPRCSILITRCPWLAAVSFFFFIKIHSRSFLSFSIRDKQFQLSMLKLINWTRFGWALHSVGFVMNRIILVGNWTLTASRYCPKEIFHFSVLSAQNHHFLVSCRQDGQTSEKSCWSCRM